MTKNKEDKIYLDDEEITKEALEEKVKNLDSNKRISEVSKNKFVTLERMNG